MFAIGLVAFRPSMPSVNVVGIVFVFGLGGTINRPERLIAIDAVLVGKVGEHGSDRVGFTTTHQSI